MRQQLIPRGGMAVQTEVVLHQLGEFGPGGFLRIVLLRPCTALGFLRGDQPLVEVHLAIAAGTDKDPATVFLGSLDVVPTAELFSDIQIKGDGTC